MPSGAIIYPQRVIRLPGSSYIFFLLTSLFLSFYLSGFICKCLRQELQSFIEGNVLIGAGIIIMNMVVCKDTYTNN